MCTQCWYTCAHIPLSHTHILARGHSEIQSQFGTILLLSEFPAWVWVPTSFSLLSLTDPHGNCVPRVLFPPGTDVKGAGMRSNLVPSAPVAYPLLAVLPPSPCSTLAADALG